MIDVVNLTRQDVDERFIREVIENTLRHLRIQGTMSLGVAFVGGARMRKLNKDFRGKDRPTDVLSFESGRNFVVPQAEGEYMGEIVVCNSQVRKRAEELGVPFQREFAHVLIHGTLHLLGYEHEESRKALEKMHAKEEEIMGVVL